MNLIEKADPDDRATNVIFKSTDGYTTILTLDYIRERNIILADSLNGNELPPAQGFPSLWSPKTDWASGGRAGLRRSNCQTTTSIEVTGKNSDTAKTEAPTNRCSTGRTRINPDRHPFRFNLAGYIRRP